MDGVHCGFRTYSWSLHCERVSLHTCGTAVFSPAKPANQPHRRRAMFDPVDPCCRPSSLQKTKPETPDVGIKGARVMSALQETQHSSQLGADNFVLSLFPNRAGYFVDVGAADGLALSNTAQLESRGWSGIAVDPLAKNFDHRSKTRCFRAVVYSHAGQDVEFAVCSQDPNLSGITKELCSYRQHVLGNAPQVARFKTVLLSDLLDSVQAPRMIEYMSLDTEGSELSILSTFPFDRYSFGVITVEHNFEEPKRGQIRQLLEQKGYVLAGAVQWDDWYVHGSVAAEMQASTVPAP